MARAWRTASQYLPQGTKLSHLNPVVNFDICEINSVQVVKLDINTGRPHVVINNAINIYFDWESGTPNIDAFLVNLMSDIFMVMKT